MQCLARNRDFRRCKNSTPFLVCHRHRWLCLIFVFVVLPGLILSYVGIGKLVSMEKSKRFHVRLETAIRGNTIVYAYAGRKSSARTLCSVDLATFVRITNKGAGLCRLRSYKANVRYLTKSKRAKGEMTLRSLRTIGPHEVFWITSRGLTHCLKCDFFRNSIDVLSAQDLAPGQTLSGWILWAYPSETKADALTLEEMSLTLETLTGEAETHILVVPKDEPSLELLNMSTITVWPSPVDLSACPWESRFAPMSSHSGGKENN